MKKSIEDYPMVLHSGHIVEILDVSKTTAYEIMDHPTFPLIKLGRLKRVMKEELFQWLSKQQINKL